ncbi:hypothetical protein [Microviridae sp.]|nr:hypothetical protein [Microviridae sp.]
MRSRCVAVSAFERAGCARSCAQGSRMDARTRAGGSFLDSLVICLGLSPPCCYFKGVRGLGCVIVNGV